MKLTEAETYAFTEIRRHLKAGATIKASDPNGRVLEPISETEIYGGMTIEYPEGANGVGMVVSGQNADLTRPDPKP